MYTHKNGITLKPIEEEDLQIIKQLKDESWFGTHTITIQNVIQQKNWFIDLDNKTNMFFIAYNNQFQKVGLYKITNIDWISRSYNSAHDVFVEYRGQGYGKTVLEAGVDFGFEVLNINRINTEVLSNNKASLKTAFYVGYKEEGIKRKAVYKCNEYVDSICLGLLREDWLELERIKQYNSICTISYTPKNN